MTQAWDIPAGWTKTAVGAISDVIGGGTPSTKEDAFWDGTIPWITSADIYGINDVRPRKSITTEAVYASATNLVPAGSIVVVTRVGLGKVAIVAEPLGFSQDSQALVFNNDEIYDLYLTYYLSEAVQAFKYQGRGTTINGVTKYQLRDLPVLLPPLPEQRRIVAEIEKQFNRLDALVAALRRAQANLRRYRASVLKTACQGDLVLTEAELARTEGRDYEPARVLLERILKERRAAWESNPKRRGKYPEPAAPDISDLPDLPEGWVWATLDQTAITVKNGYSMQPDGWGDTPILRISAVRPMSVDMNDVRWVSNSHALQDFLISQGDLLFTRYNGNPSFVGVCGVVPRIEQNTLHPDKLIRVQLNQSQGGMCICRVLGIGAGVSRECFGS